ncbi:hypothetical protein BKA62DRAFT_707817 [Auriculariales sp. MPI-PUGE-AT-0066]|nr:hypothetical protein BKA62DRAFT_707817 [Auriculariales sp. MPI-PUGE-AT-0066]
MDGAEDLDWGEEVQVNEDDAISLGAASDDDLEQIQKYKGAADDEGDEGDDGPPPGTPPRRALHPLVPPPPALTVDEPADGHAAAVHGPAGAVATLEPSPKASTGSVSPSQPADDNDNDNGDSAAQADTRNTRSQNRFSVPHPLPERPLAQQDSQDSQEMSVSLTASAMAVPHSRRDSLPHGWNTKTSSTGEVYFINVVTRETQWERPTVPAENRRRTRTELPMESTRNDTQRPNGRESRRDMDSYRPNPDSSGRDSRWRSQQGDIDSSDRVPARGSRGFGANGIANEPRRAPDPNVDSRRGDMQNTRRPRFDSYRPDSDDHRGPLVPRDDLRPSGIAARDNADRRPPRDGPADAGWSRTRGLQGPIDERRTIANDHPRQPRNGPIDDHRGHSQRSPPRQFAEPDRPAPSERYRDRVDTVSQQRQTVPEGGSSRWPADQDVSILDKRGPHIITFCPPLRSHLDAPSTIQIAAPCGANPKLDLAVPRSARRHAMTCPHRVRSRLHVITRRIPHQDRAACVTPLFQRRVVTHYPICLSFFASPFCDEQGLLAKSRMICATLGPRDPTTAAGNGPTDQCAMMTVPWDALRTRPCARWTATVDR